MDADRLELAEERYAIMAEQVDITPEQILNHLGKLYGQEITDYIKTKYKMPVNAPKQAVNGPGSAQTSNIITDHTSAPQKPAMSVCADFDTLSKYINAGIKLIPTKPNQEGNFYQLHKNKGTPQEELIKIDSLPGLQYWMHNGIERFIFIPKDAGFLCFDLDRNHGDGVDGVSNFYTWLKDNGLEQIQLLQRLENFPVYTKTASGGLHLYFKCTGDFETFSTIAPGVEIKYNGRNLTAGGSVKNGKPYSLHGELNSAPLIPAPLLLKLSKVLSQEPPKRKPAPKYYQAKEKKGFTADQLLDYARQDARGGNHDTILQMAGRLKRAGYSEADTIAIIEATPEHQGRKDKQDTFSCIASIYR